MRVKKPGFRSLKDSVCLSCGKVFKTCNPIGNRICSACAKKNKDVHITKYKVNDDFFEKI